MGARQPCAGAPNLRGARGWGHGGSSGVRWYPEPPACTRLGAWGHVRRALVPTTSRAGRETSRVEVAGRRGPRAGEDEGGEGDVGGGGGLEEMGRESCRDSEWQCVCSSVGEITLKKKKRN